MYYFLTSHQQLSLSKSFCSPRWAGNFGVNSTRYLNLEGDQVTPGAGQWVTRFLLLSPCLDPALGEEKYMTERC